ncbi:MAG: FGGY-family carbohydrate kinase, partial [Clostridia bacterium]|nr:FGGY-family carbohydrate kinase [Clostridia bacterium]
ELKVDGGASNSDFLMQFQADILGIDVIKPMTIETTALGAACLAGLGVGFWLNQEEIGKNYRIAYSLKPKMCRNEAERLYEGWQKAVKRSMNWA